MGQYPHDKLTGFKAQDYSSDELTSVLFQIHASVYEC